MDYGLFFPRIAIVNFMPVILPNVLDPLHYTNMTFSMMAVRYGMPEEGSVFIGSRRKSYVRYQEPERVEEKTSRIIFMDKQTMRPIDDVQCVIAWYYTYNTQTREKTSEKPIYPAVGFVDDALTAAILRNERTWNEGSV